MSEANEDRLVRKDDLGRDVPDSLLEAAQRNMA